MNMKTILTSIVVGSLLSTFTMAQPSPSVAAGNGLGARACSEIQPASSRVDAAAQPCRRWGLADRAAHLRGDDSASAQSRLLVYVITGGSQFGALDLRSGAFVPIGPGLPPDVGGGLVPGRGGSLLTLSFSGNLDAVDPATGQTVRVGATGLGDCSTPASPCGLNSAVVIGHLDDTYYATDFAQNLYSVNPRTGAAKLIGSTGIP